VRSERGQVSIVLIGMLVAGLLVIGAAFDGTRVFLARRDAANVADAAALAGASAVDEAEFRASNGTVVQLDREAAVREAHSIDGAEDAAVVAEDDRVSVRVVEDVPMVLFRFLGTERVGVTAVARPRTR